MTVQDIASQCNGEVVGDGTRTIDRSAKIEEAGSGSVTFLANPRYERFLATTNATAVIVSRKLDLARHRGRASLVFILVDDPYLAFLRVTKELSPQADPFSPGIHPTAAVAVSATLGQDVAIGPHAVIGEGARIGNRVKVDGGVVVGRNAVIGDDCIVYANVVVYHDCVVGNRVILHGGTVVGSDGFGWAPKPDGTYEKIPQLGRVVIEDDVSVGANCTIDRATLGETILRRGVKLDNLIQIAHNVVVGEHTVIAAQTGVAGSTKVGKHCIIAGQVAISGHLEIADRTTVLGQSGISKSVTVAGKVLFGYPAKEQKKAQRIEAALRSLPELAREFAQLRRDVEALKPGPPIAKPRT